MEHIIAGLLVGMRWGAATVLGAERERYFHRFGWLVVGAQTEVGADKAYQVKGFIAGLRELGVVPHVAEYERSLPQWPNCLTQQEREHFGFAISQANRKRIEKSFGWIKFIAGLRKTKFRGRRRVQWMFCLAAAASNLIRMAKLIPREA